MSKADEIQIEDFKWTNVNLKGQFGIVLGDDRFYVVHRGRGKEWIEKDGNKIFLSEKVSQVHRAQVREYQREGI